MKARRMGSKIAEKYNFLYYYVLSNDKLTTYIIEPKQRKDRLGFEGSEESTL